MLEVFLEPPLYARRQFVHALEGERTFALPIECDHHVAAKFSHRGTKLTTHFDREQISVKVIPLRGSRHCTIRTDQPQVKSKLGSHGEGVCMSPPGDQDYLRSGGMCLPQGVNIPRRNSKL